MGRIAMSNQDSDEKSLDPIKDGIRFLPALPKTF
jgi:hypothetical protein